MGTASTSIHTVPRGGGAEVTPAEGYWVDDGVGGFKPDPTGPATAHLVSDGAGGLKVAATGTVAGQIIRFGDSYRVRAT